MKTKRSEEQAVLVVVSFRRVSCLRHGFCVLETVEEKNEWREKRMTFVLLNARDKEFLVVEKTSYDHPHKLFNTILYIANRKNGCSESLRPSFSLRTHFWAESQPADFFSSLD